jgi:ABC-2 type transport system permease protein
MLKLSIVKRDVKSFFGSPLAYVVGGVFSLISGWLFFTLLAHFADMQTRGIAGQFSFVNQVVIKQFGNLNFLIIFITPILTMRLISEERKNNSYELLMAAPISDWQIVLSKFTSSMCFSLFLVVLSLMFPFILWTSGMQEVNVVLTGYLGLFFNIMLYSSIGLFASSLTDNQVVSAIISFVIILSLFFITYTSLVTSNYILVQMLTYVGVLPHFQTFVSGNISLSDCFYYLSGTYFFLYLTKNSLEAKRW